MFIIFELYIYHYAGIILQHILLFFWNRYKANTSFQSETDIWLSMHVHASRIMNSAHKIRNSTSRIISSYEYEKYSVEQSVKILLQTIF